MVYRRKGCSMPGIRIVNGKKYDLDNMYVFGGDKNRRIKELKTQGYKVKTFIEQHIKDTAGAWVIYKYKK